MINEESLEEFKECIEIARKNSPISYLFLQKIWNDNSSQFLYSSWMPFPPEIWLGFDHKKQQYHHSMFTSFPIEKTLSRLSLKGIELYHLSNSHKKCSKIDTEGRSVGMDYHLLKENINRFYFSYFSTDRIDNLENHLLLEETISEEILPVPPYRLQNFN